MGFLDVLERWRADGDAVDVDRADRANEVWAVFDRMHPQVAKNLDSDPNIKDSLRSELLRQLLIIHNENESLVENHVFTFCRGNPLIGERLDLPPDCLFGHVKPRAIFVNLLNNTRRGPAQSAGSLILKRVLSLTSEAQRALLHDVAITDRLTWGFYDPSTHGDPFQNISTKIEDLINHLGLCTVKLPEELVFFTYRLEVGKLAHCPTAFDAVNYVGYRPGGCVRKLDGTQGPLEAVHECIFGRCLVSPIREAE